MNKIKLLSVAAILGAVCLTGCSKQGGGESEEEKPYAPIVFVMAGQSNMEGNSYFDNGNKWLEKALTKLGIEDGDKCFDGIDSVLTSYYGCGYVEITNENNIHASNTEKGKKIQGKFLPTKVGMGAKDTMFGPELGLAYALSEYATAEQPIYLIKNGISGSGFAQSGTDYNWDVTLTKNAYELSLKKFVQNNLNNIEEETGLKPVIKGFIWHQGESDSDEKKIPNYKTNMDNLLNKFKEDFEGYAPDEDKENIAFIDCTLSTQSGAAANNKGVNAEKVKISEESDMNFLVDGNEAGLKICTSGFGDNKGANGSLHYEAESEFKMGTLFGQVIINNLLD